METLKSVLKKKLEVTSSISRFNFEHSVVVRVISYPHPHPEVIDESRCYCETPEIKWISKLSKESYVPIKETLHSSYGTFEDLNGSSCLNRLDVRESNDHDEIFYSLDLKEFTVSFGGVTKPFYKVLFEDVEIETFERGEVVQGDLVIDSKGHSYIITSYFEDVLIDGESVGRELEVELYDGTITYRVIR